MAKQYLIENRAYDSTTFLALNDGGKQSLNHYCNKELTIWQ